MALVYLLLGTNLGERGENLSVAGSFLEKTLGPRVGASLTIETEAIGFEGPSFLNRVEVYATRLQPKGVLNACKAVERKMGRNEIMEYRPDGTRVYHSRIIDIDILEYRILKDLTKTVTINIPGLIIPHPQVKERPFVRPLLEEALQKTINSK